MTKVLYAVDVSESATGCLLESLRFVLNPDVSNRAHITIRGPYSRSLPAEYVESLRKRIEGSEIFLSRIGHFFSETQNTVYIEAVSPALSEVWKKADYSYNPHITLYDGKSRRVARNALRLLEEWFRSTPIIAGDVLTLRSGGAGESVTPSEECWRSLRAIGALGGLPTPDGVRRLNEHQRIELVRDLLERLPLPASGSGADRRRKSTSEITSDESRKFTPGSNSVGTFGRLEKHWAQYEFSEYGSYLAVAEGRDSEAGEGGVADDPVGVQDAVERSLATAISTGLKNGVAATEYLMAFEIEDAETAGMEPHERAYVDSEKADVVADGLARALIDTLRNGH